MPFARSACIHRDSMPPVGKSMGCRETKCLRCAIDLGFCIRNRLSRLGDNDSSKFLTPRQNQPCNPIQCRRPSTGSHFSGRCECPVSGSHRFLDIATPSDADIRHIFTRPWIQNRPNQSRLDASTIKIKGLHETGISLCGPNRQSVGNSSFISGMLLLLTTALPTPVLRIAERISGKRNLCAGKLRVDKPSHHRVCPRNPQRLGNSPTAQMLQ